jgi:hypothetical protein
VGIKVGFSGGRGGVARDSKVDRKLQRKRVSSLATSITNLTGSCNESYVCSSVMLPWFDVRCSSPAVMS